MKKYFLSIAITLLFYSLANSQVALRVMVIFAHPDEGEIYTGGITALYTKMGHQVKFMSLTNGDAGHYSMKPADLAKMRYQEAMESKQILSLGDYEVLDYHDQFLKNTKESQDKVIKSIQDWNPDIVFTYYPAKGGHTDNMTAGYIVRDAAPRLQMAKMPVFVYMRDFFTITFSYVPDFAIAIDSVWQTKLAACSAMRSQVMDAIPHSMGILDEVRADPAKQKELIYQNTYPYSSVTNVNMPALEKWYGQDAASKIRYAEAFEIAEFGRQPTEAEMQSLFPMLPRSTIVAATKDWTATRIEVSEGDILDIIASGKILWKKEGSLGCGPDGVSTFSGEAGKPIPGGHTGSLIARIGTDGQAIIVGTSQKIIAPKAGKLYLGINDGNLTDNDGEFRVWIKVNQH
jgi:LmbE family N-acetylglucosaminyl deacetylase